MADAGFLTNSETSKTLPANVFNPTFSKKQTSKIQNTFIS